MLKPYEEGSFTRCFIPAFALTSSTAFPQIFEADFNDGNDIGLTRISPLLRQIQARSDPGRALSVISDRFYSSFSISADIANWDNNHPQSFGLIANWTDSDVYSYALAYTPEGFGIFAVQPNGTLLAKTKFRFSLDPGQAYHLSFRGDDTFLEGKLFRTENLSTPLLTVRPDPSSKV